MASEGLLLGGRALVRAGDGETLRAVPGSDLALLFFTASWCPACTRFGPLLADFQEELGGSPLPVVCISRDRTEAEFRASLSAEHVPDDWLALSFAERELGRQLEAALGVRLIPSLAVLRIADAAIVSPVADARSEVIAGPASYAKWLEAARGELPPLPPLEGGAALGASAAAA